MEKEKLGPFAAWALGLLLFIATLIIIRWTVDFINWSTLDSGWAQVLGAVGALAVAIYIMNEQHRREEKRRICDAAVRKAGLIRASIGIGYRTHHALQELKKVISAQGCNPTTLRYEQSVFGQLLVSISQIPIWEMGGQEGNALQSFATTCATIASIIEAALTDSNARGEDLVKFIEKHITTTRQQRDYLVILLGT